ncbi:hypothetical protein HCU74_06120 [Spongiibacter sp. KMU-166]|uniref:SPOR domain-containing protein n=1 Tax=Spongiibacter thalassae TaxID=2721624 RepID=A0ABX1GDH7_9GAMM|nr:SPOR domain-containing protein [Spongiibacter thalassae]NKI16995.1 hypothetical protein [Spongiibacter thalassae]
MVKQRLVGLLVLLCGGIILWSVLFTAPAEYKVDRNSQIPVPPRLEAMPDMDADEPQGIPSADSPIVVEQEVLPISDGDTPPGKAEPTPRPEPTARTQVTPEPPTPVVEPKPEPKAEPKPEPKPAKVKTAAPPAEPTAEARGLPVAWVIQCGSFGQQANADGLVERLRSGGYKAYAERIERGGKSLYRVLVGPALNRERAESLQVEINRRFELNTILTRFEG